MSERATDETTGQGWPDAGVLADLVPVGLDLVDRELEIRRANRELCRLLGRKRTDLEGRALFDVFPGLGARRSLIGSALAGYRSEPHELDACVGTAALRLEVAYRPWQDSDGETGGLLLLLEEVGTRGTRLHRLSAELESLSHAVSHDLRAPLRHLLAFSELLTQQHASQLDEDARTVTSFLRDAAHEATSMLDALLSYSRLCRQPPEAERIPLGEVLGPALARLKPGWGQPGEAAPGGDLPVVLADRSLLHLAVEQILDNAVKFTGPSGGQTIGIGAEVRAGMVRFWVEDNGPGVPPLDRERIFGVFARGPNAREVPGTGIGLALVRRAADMMGGRAGVDQRESGGSRFWVEVPAG